jgi:hypothetical protein
LHAYEIQGAKNSAGHPVALQTVGPAALLK